jgi:hypothetical protein
MRKVIVRTAGFSAFMLHSFPMSKALSSGRTANWATNAFFHLPPPHLQLQDGTKIVDGLVIGRGTAQRAMSNLPVKRLRLTHGSVSSMALACVKHARRSLPKF